MHLKMPRGRVSHVVGVCVVCMLVMGGAAAQSVSDSIITASPTTDNMEIMISTSVVDNFLEPEMTSVFSSPTPVPTSTTTMSDMPTSDIGTQEPPSPTPSPSQILDTLTTTAEVVLSPSSSAIPGSSSIIQSSSMATTPMPITPTPVTSPVQTSSPEETTPTPTEEITSTKGFTDTPSRVPPTTAESSGLSQGAIIGIAAGVGGALLVVVFLGFCCCCIYCCCCRDKGTHEYTTGNEGFRPHIVVRTYTQNVERAGSVISRGSRGSFSRSSITSSIRSSIRRLSGKRRSKTKEHLVKEEPIAMKVTPL